MAKRRVHAYPAEKDGEVLRRVELWSDRSWTINPVGGYYIVRVGVARGDYADFIGEWDQRSVALSKGTPLALTGNTDANFPLREGDVCVVEVEVNGQPPKIDGLSIVFRIPQVGDLSRQAGAKQDPDYPGPREVIRPLFEAPVIANAEVRSAMSRLVDSMNDSGITEKVISFPIPDLFQSLAREIRWAWTETLSTTAISNGAFITMAEVDVRFLDPSRRYRLMANGFLNVQQDGSATDVQLRIVNANDSAALGTITQTAPASPAWEVMGTSAQASFFGYSSINVELQAKGVSAAAVAQEGSLSVQVADMIDLGEEV